MKIVNEDEYGQTICQYFNREFFEVIETSNKDLLEILASLLVSTKEHRYGPIPEPESLVIVRQTIRKAIDMGLPIPILIPWGGRKAKVNGTIDVAEVFAMSQVINLQKAIQRYYSPGLFVNMRVEDTNANWLYRNDPTSKAVVEKYSTDFTNLITLLDGQHFIHPIKESNLMNEEEYFRRSDKLAILLNAVLKHQTAFPDSDVKKLNEFQELSEAGWKGVIPIEQRNYYLKRYSSLYPDLSNEDFVRMLADYFAGSKARHDMNGVANPVTPVGSYIVLSFVTPIPGAPESLFNNRLYWRTVPYSNGRTHIPAWRAKGYFKIGETAKAKVTSFNDPIVNELIPSCTTLQEGAITLDIQSDYLVE